MTVTKKIKLGDILVNESIISQDHLEKALKSQDRKKKRLGKVLIDMGLTTEQEIAAAICMQLGMRLVNLHELAPNPDTVHLLEKDFVIDNLMVPIGLDGNKLTVAVADPLNHKALDKAASISRRSIETVISTESEILDYIERAYNINDAIQNMLSRFRVQEGLCFFALPQDDETDVRKCYDVNDSSPVRKVVAFIIMDAVHKGAGEIYIEPTETEVRLRYRVRGDLVNIIGLPQALRDTLVYHIKIIANMDVSNRRNPQEGATEAVLSGKNIHMDVSTLPTLSGERVYISLFEKDRYAKSFTELGISGTESEALMELFNEGQGLVLFTGTTGNGKTTTMYAALRELVSETRDVVTVGPRASYRLQRATQVEAPKGAESSTIRRLINQRPDILLIEDLDDRESAVLALEYALDGGLVLAALNAKHAAAAVARLSALGVSPKLIASGISGIVSQRLIKNICPDCKIPYKPDMSKFPHIVFEQPSLYVKGKGCQSCQKTGFKGTSAIIEAVKPSGRVRSLISSETDSDMLLDAIMSQGQKTLAESAWELVRSGITTVGEADQRIPRELWAVRQPSKVKPAPAAQPSQPQEQPEPFEPEETFEPEEAVESTTPGETSAPVTEALPPEWREQPEAAQPIPAPQQAAAPAGKKDSLFAAKDDFMNIMRQYKVLLAISDEGESERAKKKLEDADYQVITTTDGNTALDMLYSDKPDILVCDMKLPYLESLVSHKKMYDKQRGRIPVISLSRTSSEQITSQEMELSTDAKLGRPYTAATLLNKVNLLVTEFLSI